MDDEAPDYRNVVHNPMDVATLLQRVDSGHYLTRAAFLSDVDLIPANAQVHHIFPNTIFYLFSYGPFYSSCRHVAYSAI